MQRDRLKDRWDTFEFFETCGVWSSRGCTENLNFWHCRLRNIRARENYARARILQAERAFKCTYLTARCVCVCVCVSATSAPPLLPIAEAKEFAVKVKTASFAQ